MRTRRKPVSTRLTLERFEDRTVPTASALNPQAPILGQAAMAHPGFQQQTFSTIPPNGDLNPYGVAFVPLDYAKGGPLHPGDILVSNFNASSNLQGTGTTIVRFDASGNQSVFFQGQPGIGLTTALGVLQRGFVIVGNVPTTDGTSGTIQQGSLLILDHNGLQVLNLSSAALLDGPWDLTVVDEGALAQVFVANVLSGTVTRLDLAVPAFGDNIVVQSSTQIASGYIHRSDPAALVIGPTGLLFNAQRDLLYVSSTGDNAIFAVPHALETQKDNGTGSIVYQDSTHLHGPLGLAALPNGNLLSSQGDAVNADPNQPSEIVQFTRSGKFVSEFSLDPVAEDAAFGIATQVTEGSLRVAAVNDNFNTLEVFTFNSGGDNVAATPLSQGGGHGSGQSASYVGVTAGTLKSDVLNQAGGVAATNIGSQNRGSRAAMPATLAQDDLQAIFDAVFGEVWGQAGRNAL